MVNSSARARELRNQGIALIRNGDRANGQELLIQSLELNPQDEYAWIWLASVADTDEERRFCLHKVLEIDPQNEAARRGLASMGLAPAPTPSAMTALAPAAAPVSAPQHASATSTHLPSSASGNPNTRPGMPLAASTLYDDHHEALARYRLRQAQAARRSATLKALGAMTLLLALALFMGFQLYQQAQLRGWIEGRQIKTYRITQKWEGFGRRGSATYWVSWTNDNIRTPGNHRLNVEYDQWVRMNIGDPIRLAFIETSQRPHLAEGDIWTSDGNILFNAVVGGGALLLGLLMGGYAIYVSKHGPIE